jgi:hypothetical protein
MKLNFKKSLEAAGVEPKAHNTSTRFNYSGLTYATKLLQIAIIILAVCLLIGCAGMKEATKGYDFYYFGVNTKMLKEANYWKVAAGAITSVAVHTAGHYAYAGLNGMSVRQDGFNEVISGNEPKQTREFMQAGFLTQNLIGLALTSIPVFRQSDFTKGYVAMAFIETVSYPLLWQNDGDLYSSDKNGGNATLEYIGYSAVALHNLLRINWEKE